MIDERLEDWIKRKKDWLLYKCTVFTKDSEEARELMAATLEKIWLIRDKLKLGENDTDSDIENWVYITTKYVWWDMINRKNRLNLKNLDSYVYLQLNNPIVHNSSSLEAISELNSINTSISSKLSKNHFKIALMKAEGYNQTEICEKLDISAPTAKKYLEETIGYIKNRYVTAKKFNERKMNKMYELWQKQIEILN